MHRLGATLNLAEAKAALHALEHELGTGSQAFEVDASALSNFDTSAIAVLLEARRQARSVGRGLVVRGAPRSMVELAGLYGVAELLGFEEAAPASPARE